MPEKKLQVQVAPTRGYNPSDVVWSKSSTQPPNKAQVAPVQVKTSSPPMSIQPEGPPPPGVEVVHVPANGSSIGIFFLPLISINYQNRPDSTTRTEKLEEEYGRVPELGRFADTFRWGSRSLYDLNFKDDAIPHRWQGIYLVYKCNENVPGLDVNQHFVQIPNVRAYGDVFLFRLKKLGQEAEYGPMERGFLQSFYENGTAKVLLCTAADMYDYHEEKKKLQNKKKKDSGAGASKAS